MATSCQLKNYGMIPWMLWRWLLLCLWIWSGLCQLCSKQTWTPLSGGFPSCRSTAGLAGWASGCWIKPTLLNILLALLEQLRRCMLGKEWGQRLLTLPESS